MFKAIDPLKYLDFAREIATRTEVEARRSAADRAYYAAFLFSRDQLAIKGYITPHYHEEDKKYISETLKRLRTSIGNDEFRLREHRTKVTYHTWDVGYPSLDWMINTAQEIIDYVKALPLKSES